MSQVHTGPFCALDNKMKKMPFYFVFSFQIRIFAKMNITMNITRNTHK